MNPVIIIPSDSPQIPYYTNLPNVDTYNQPAYIVSAPDSPQIPYYASLDTYNSGTHVYIASAPDSPQIPYRPLHHVHEPLQTHTRDTRRDPATEGQPTRQKKTSTTPQRFTTIVSQRHDSKVNYVPSRPTPVQSGSHSRYSTPPEAMLQDLTKYITKDERFPAARGGFGEVWKCTYKKADRKVEKVAVKALIMYSTDQSGEAKDKKIKKIRRELKTCARLQHRHIQPIYGYTYGFGPLIAIVSPWAENGNLTTYLERPGAALTDIRRFQILKDITRGLQYLHANNVIHADLNGPNVLIYGDGTACLADFGISLVYSELASVSQASWTSTLKGNIRWMAPELLEEREDGTLVRPSKQSDIYSFGGIMLQVLTNKIPYYHLSRDPAIILCISTLQKPSRSLYPVISDKYWRFIEECWSAKPRKRPSTERVVDMIQGEFDSLTSSRRGSVSPRPYFRAEGQGGRGDKYEYDKHGRVTRWLGGLFRT